MKARHFSSNVMMALFDSKDKKKIAEREKKEKKEQLEQKRKLEQGKKLAIRCETE